MSNVLGLDACYGRTYLNMEMAFGSGTNVVDNFYKNTQDKMILMHKCVCVCMCIYVHEWVDIFVFTCLECHHMRLLLASLELQNDLTNYSPATISWIR